MRHLGVGAIVFGAMIGCGVPKGPRPIDVVTVPTNQQEDEAKPPPTAKNGAKSGAKPTATNDTPKSAGWRAGHGGFPVPADADAGTPMNATDITYQVPRKRDHIHTELLAKMAEDGYILDNEQFEMEGYRMTIHKDENKFFVSVTDNDGESTLMTVTPK